jgi:hypothetical protein
LRNIGAETNERQFSQTNGYIQKNNQTAHEVGWLSDGMELELYNELDNYPPSLVEMNRNESAAGARTSTWFDTDL